MPPVLRLLRPHQWVKNLLLMVPLVLAHVLDEWTRVVDVAGAILGFCLCASAVYVVNDLVDVEADRAHPTKHRRPLAAGTVAAPFAKILAIVLVVSGLALGYAVSMSTLAWMGLYVGITSLYSFWLKRLVIVDVVVLSGLYTLRLAAGASAADVPMSGWLATFSLFFFTSLAFLKRYVELRDTVEREGRVIAGRGYHVGDAVFVAVTGVAIGFLAVLVFTLYLQSPDVRMLYTRPDVLWFVLPLVIYWVSRTWLVAWRGTMHDDPIVFAMRDIPSYVVIGLTAVILYVAML